MSIAASVVVLANEPVGTTGPSSTLSTKKSLKDEVFVVESDENDASDGIDRISGDIDLGFATPDQTYKSENQTKAGPFGRQEAVDSAEENAKSSQRY